MEEQNLKKPDNGYGGSRKNSGRKSKAKILTELTVEAQKKVYSLLEADFWVKMANNKAIPRLEAILDNPDTNDEVLMKAIKEVLDRTLGRSKESIDHTTKGQSLRIPFFEDYVRTNNRNIESKENDEKDSGSPGRNVSLEDHLDPSLSA